MPSKNPEIKKAFKDGVITKGQDEKLSDGLLLGIIKKKNGGGGGKGGSGGKKGGKGVKEERHKLGKEAHKRGRPKGGSKVRVSK